MSNGDFAKMWIVVGHARGNVGVVWFVGSDGGAQGVRSGLTVYTVLRLWYSHVVTCSGLCPATG